MGYDAEDFIHVDPERTRGLVTTLNSAADTLAGIRADDQALESAITMSSLLPGTAVNSACLSGATTATNALQAATEQVRVLAVRTDNGLATVLAQEAETAGKFTQLGQEQR
ncbi:hypothetical protein HLB23_03775 [Nocardia uniformis]|uniref:Uncharacterized protein n=1 Tax=Nocardia uniformis TaxID=53432 RepID=A0A849BXJ1_9NOCA|nr:hypothetical protein [Nocardia uniformis]NNH69000.1 hypothetical protein [Nocardia uniformis]